MVDMQYLYLYFKHVGCQHDGPGESVGDVAAHADPPLLGAGHGGGGRQRGGEPGGGVQPPHGGGPAGPVHCTVHSAAIMSMRPVCGHTEVCCKGGRQ